MGRICLGLILLLGSALPALATAGTPVPRVIALPAHGALVLTIPDGWQDETRQPGQRLPPTVLIGPREGQKFQILISVVCPLSATAGRTDEATLRAEVASAAKSAQPQAVEQSLPIKEFAGADGRGFCFFATDRAPAPGEFKYLTQGAIRLGKIALVFTVLTNDGQDTVIKQVFEMLRTAEHRPGGASL